MVAAFTFLHYLYIIRIINLLEVLFRESSCFTLLSRLCHISSFADVHGAPPPIKSGYHSSSLLCTLTSQAPNLCSPYNFKKRYIASILKNNEKKHMFGQNSFRLPVQNDHMSEIITDPNLNQLTTHSPPKSKEGKLWDFQAVQQIRHGMPRHFTAQNELTLPRKWRGGRKDQRCLFCYHTWWLIFHLRKWHEMTIMTGQVDWLIEILSIATTLRAAWSNSAMPALHVSKVVGQKTMAAKQNVSWVQNAKCRTMSISTCWESLGNRHRRCFMRVCVCR